MRSGSALASVACLAVMKPFSSMRSMMYNCLERARLGLLIGLYAEGALGKPANMAASAMLMSLSGLPK